MATHHVNTVTHGTAPELTDVEAVMALLKEYNVHVNWEIEQGNQLTIWGENYLSVSRTTSENETIHDVEREFLYRLSQYIAEGHELDLRSVGNTKCRSVSAIRWVVRPNLVLNDGFGARPTIVDPPAELAEVLDENTLAAISEAIETEVSSTAESDSPNPA